MPKFAEKEEKSEKPIGRLAMAPSLDNSYVQEQLQKMVGTKVPEELANAIVETGQASKVREIAEALENIIEYSGMESEHAVNCFEDESLAKSFVSHTESFVSISEAAKKGTKEAFDALKQEDISRAFAKNPEKATDAFVRIAWEAGTHQGDAFWTLARKPIAAAFAKDMDKTGHALERIGIAAGTHAGDAFWALGRLPIAKAFAKNMEQTTKALEDIGTAAGAHSGDAFWLLGSRDIAPLFGKKPSQVADTFVSIVEASGEYSGRIFTRLGKKGVIEHFAKNMDGVVDAFSRISESNGLGKEYAMGVICTEEFIGGKFATPSQLADAFVESADICGRKNIRMFSMLLYGPLRKAMAADPTRIAKLAEASTYTPILRTVIDMVKNDDPAEAKQISRLLDNPSELAKTAITSLLLHRSEWEAGRALAKASGVRVEDREVFINFAYAEENIGAEKTKAIYREYGIEYFARYSKEELEDLYEHIGETEDNRPLLLIAYNKSDDTNVFYLPEIVGEREILERKGHYNIVFVEAENKAELFEKAKKFSEKYFGISDIMIGGHGTAKSIRLGPGLNGTPEGNFLNLLDMKDLEALKGLFADDARVFLASCSTGKDEKAIGARISDAWDAELVAPKQPADILGFDLDEKGRITGPIYNVDEGLFIDGVELSP
ncbi:hypothetical protein JW721_02595 [Candidatus Micrarchaeota archaeon]|nr:hypothetical protein [Candidatus Micrarchaeota archaeon]